MRRLPHLILLAVLVLVMMWWHRHVPSQIGPTNSVATSPADNGTASTLPAYLPPEARDTLALIAHGGPFPHSQDGVVFGNYEHLLPEQPRGYYHEYTVETPGAGNRGARRIITGGTPPDIYYYTDDHYRSFRSFKVSP
ncbi:ribonuclease domain-containing protein [Rhodanobacter sp. C01]|uniref:ribonuclease domain-containing protein n=1 Tax=Rhodanobacter sp. C01 TaxID=1945856 RepID=UPI000987B58C|nr:ribonuclease domain-containing protein [Rhodanobacter sp. C01]OOG47048.1 ribonuclease [Rhodanobacter sp. C01]